MVSRQVKSKERVAAHGEVFTAEREVKAMCDLVKPETERIESRFLEPACGNGNFLAEVLSRKLVVVETRYRQSLPEYERYAFLAVSSIYGVEILPDNAEECRQRLFTFWQKFYEKAQKKAPPEDIAQSIRFVLTRNILCGDALTLLQADGTPIIFSEWSFITGDIVKRRDFRLDLLMKGEAEKQKRQAMLFVPGWEYDAEMQTFIPAPIREFEPIDYRRLAYA
ncbi:MAG: SAM-dependent DNA methyltransferase [Desulfovibrionaceae bacterium]